MSKRFSTLDTTRLLFEHPKILFRMIERMDRNEARYIRESDLVAEVMDYTGNLGKADRDRVRLAMNTDNLFRSRLIIDIIKADGERPRSARWRRLVDGVVDAVQRRALARHVHVLSFDAEVLALVGRRAPELPRVWNVDAPVEWSPVFQRRLAKVGTLCLPARFATATLGRRLQEQDRALWVYRCDTEHALLLARRSGATMLITDDPAWLRRRLRETASVR